MADLRYPIGKFEPPTVVTDELRKTYIRQIADAPANMRAAVAGLNSQQLDTPYRPDGWTVRQVVHHVADSHINSYVRFKLALTEQQPTIKPYNQSAWAELVDAKTGDVESSLVLLEMLHKRLDAFLQSCSPADFQRTFVHPDQGVRTLDVTLALYAWHGRHHSAHITSLRERMGWK